jgi:ATP-dependent protease ClpP protease subunit
MSSLNSRAEAADILAKARMFVIDDEEIGAKTVELTKSIAGRLLIAGAPDVAVIIDSKGGRVDYGLDIFDILDTYPGHKTAIVYGRASSIAAVILQACDQRLCARHASILIHDTREDFSLTTARHPLKFAKWLEEGEKVQAKVYRILSERTGLSINKIRALSERDKSLNPEEALKHRLIDRILTKSDMAKHFRPEVLQKLQKKATPN